MSTLYEKAQEILMEKRTKVIPSNIKKGVTMFGVTGDLEITEKSKIKLYPSIIARDADITCETGDIGLVYKEQTLLNWDSNTIIRGVICKSSVPKDIMQTLDVKYTILSSGGSVDVYSYGEDNAQYQIILRDNNSVGASSISMVYTLVNNDYMLQNSNGVLSDGVALKEGFQEVFKQIFDVIDYEFTGLYRAKTALGNDTTQVKLANNRFQETEVIQLNKLCPDYYNTYYDPTMSEEDRLKTYISIIKDSSDNYYVYRGCALVILNKDGIQYLAEEYITNKIPTSVQKYDSNFRLLEQYEIPIRTTPIYYDEEEIDWNNDGTPDYTRIIGYYNIDEFSSNNTIFIGMQGYVDEISLIPTENDKYTVQYGNFFNGMVRKQIVVWSNLETQLSNVTTADIIKGKTVYGNNGVIKGTYVETTDSAAYFNRETNKGINYVIECSGPKTKKVGDYEFEVEMVTADFIGNTGPMRINYGVRPLNFKLDKMDLTIQLFGKDGTPVYEYFRKDAPITNTQYYKGEEYWTETDSEYLSSDWPTKEQFMQVFDFDAKIENVRPVVYETKTISNQQVGPHDGTEIPFDIKLINGASVEGDHIHIIPKSYIESVDTFGNSKLPYTLEFEVQVKQPQTHGNIFGVGRWSNGFAMYYDFSNTQQIQVRYGVTESLSNERIPEYLTLSSKSLITAVVTDENIKVYVNGNLLFTRTKNMWGLPESNPNEELLESGKLCINYGPDYLNDQDSNLKSFDMEMNVYAIRYYNEAIYEDQARIHYDNYLSRNN